MVGELYLGGEGLVCGYVVVLVFIVECFVFLLVLCVFGEWLYCIGDFVC